VFWAGIAIVLLVIGLRVYYVAFLRGPKIIRKWVQPDDIHYDEDDPYAVAVIQDGYVYTWWLPRPRYYVVFMPLDSLLESGSMHNQTYSFSNEVLKREIDHLSVTWTKVGPGLSFYEFPMMFFPNESLIEKWEKELDDPTSTEQEPSSTIRTTDEQP